MTEVQSVQTQSRLPPKAEQVPFKLTETTIEGARGNVNALVITPRAPLHFNRARLERIRFSMSLSAAEYWLVAQAKKRPNSASIMIFRAVDQDRGRVLEFGTDLGEHELEEGGYVFTRALLPLHRRLLAAGVLLMIHTDWGGRPCYAMRQGKRRMLEEFRTSTYQTAERAADEWALKHMLLHVALPFEHVKNQLLPGHLPAIERRRAHVERLVRSLPKTSIE